MYIEDFEISDTCYEIIGSPVMLCFKQKNKFIDEQGFSIVQCKRCKGVLTHTGYYIKNLSFSYGINCTVNELMQIICDCHCLLGVKLTYFNFESDFIVISKFPKLVLQSALSFSSFLNDSQSSIDDLKSSYADIIKNYEQRIEESKKSIRKLNKYIVKIYKLYSQTLPEGNNANKIFSQ